MSTLDARNNSAMMKRAEQLKRWEESDTNRAAPTPRHEHGRRIKFSSGCVFLAACLSGDKDEVIQLLDQGADINTANVDGLTALHQACIDDNLHMVEFLVKRGADINRQDNEGWTPLHATASCGFVSIARYLVENGADVAAVNSDGDLALDLAIDVQHRGMIEYMEKIVQELNIDVEQARKAEEEAMLSDAERWLSSDAAEVDRPHPKTGATALHVAAAKGYTNVLSLLLEGRGNVDRQDNDGWTPLHAASHWGQQETSRMLVESLADMDIRNYAGQSCIDVADRKIVKFLEELRAKNRNQRRPSSQIRISDAIENRVDKTPTKLVRVEVRTDATKDAASSSNCASSSEASLPIDNDNDDIDDDDDNDDDDDAVAHESDAEELSDSTESSHTTSLSGESEAENVKPNQQQIHALEHPVEEEAPWRRKMARAPNDSPTNNQVPDRELSSNSSESANDVILRRTQSFENDEKFYQKYNELRARIKANSCPILPATAASQAAAAAAAASAAANNSNSNNNNNLSSNNNNKFNNNNNNKSALLLGSRTTNNTATTTTTSSTFNNTHNNTTTSTPQTAAAAAAAAAAASTAATTNPYYSVQRSASLKDNSMYYRKPTVTHVGTPTGTAATAKTTLLSSPSTNALTPPIRSQVTAKTTAQSNNGSSSTASASASASASDVETAKPPPKQSTGNIIKNFFKSFVPPVRDEESETQRKAHAKRVRETRRSTQGVTLDEIKSAEELVKKKNMGMANNNNNNNNNISSSGSFKLEDNTSGGTYPPNNSTIIPSAPAVMAAANLSTTTGIQRRISSGPNALNASNQSLNSVGRPISAPSESTNNSSAYATPAVRKYETTSTGAGTGVGARVGAAATTTATTTANSVSATSANHAAGTAATTNATSSHDDKENDKENDNRTQTVIQRRRKPKRRSTGVVHLDVDELDPERQNEEKDKESGSERTSRSRLGSTTSTAATSTTRSESKGSSDKSENGDGIDYKALWEAAKLENDKLKQVLKQKDDEVVQTRATLERFANATTKNSLSEIEKRERRAMERKLSELEEELKLLQKLKTENDRLRAENRALTRVVSKLTTSAQSQLAKAK
ncbi:protein phosphatase 1 regulatory subunit 12C isoform X12 [Drosophila pseudoobscura]|uniref:Protein phosphatase 1 regulatory subunit 12B n=1 Tax=Drosophila pseudoobscura pseudoobscura TaxID=46245 RepID=A0A6I8W814_DROPS|nr:protein phosphatase 1 regulatory subunit 12C isoform X12 [Drosophila pseudoobscura]